MTIPANLRINARFPFPSLVQGSGPVTIGKTNGIWTVGLNVSNLAVQVPVGGQLTTDYALVWDSVTGSFINVALSSLLAASGAVPVIREPAQAATIAILATDIEVGISTAGSAVNATLPSAAAWAAATQDGLDLCISDRSGNAAANNITLTLSGSDTFRGGVAPSVKTNFGLVRLRPVNALNGWYVR